MSMDAPTSPLTKIRRMTLWFFLFVALLLAGPVMTLAFGRASVGGDWRTATHRSAGLAPDPASHHEAVVQVYASRAFAWRGAFADHTWLAVKPEGADRFTRYEVIGWYGRAGGSVVSVSDQRAPDAEWFGAAPRLIRDVRGADADAIIRKLPQAVAAYPYGASYSVWPGPNSNTFVATVLRAAPELEVAMPSEAIGKDFRTDGAVFGLTGSGTGVEASLWGLLGLKLGWVEGLEVNLLSLVAGLDIRRPAVKLPGFGRIGMESATALAKPR